MSEERRVVTVMFADVAGSTSLGEELDPEDVRELMGGYFAAAQTAVADHGGTLEKFIGDAVMAVFGLPRAHGDDAERAFSAAAALRDAIRADAGLARLQLRFGLATGEVVASREPGRDQFLVTGDAVNVAARLQQFAEPWEILATERTAFDARARFDFGEVRQIEVKGRAEPVAVRSLMGRAAGRPARPVVAFVGREDELDQMRLVARRAFRDGNPAVISIVATAGTGKSRLVEQFTGEVLPTFAPGARIEVAQCLPYGRQLTYWPLRAVLFSLAGLDDGAEAAEILPRLETWTGDRREAELLAATVGAESAASADPTELFAAWRSALARAGKERPLVLIFEDLHWSSDSLLDLVDFVMDPREQVPVVMIGIARPELLDRRVGWGGGRRNFLSIYLDPLPDADIEAVVRPLLGDVPEDVLAEVIRRCEGNPFFAGELARAAVEGGASSLPDTVQATVLARLDLLDEAPRRALQVASVFGRSFSPEGVAALAPEAAGDLAALIDGLQARDLVRRQDAEHFAFRHILIREVAYSTLSRSERGRLHAAAGDWLAARAEGREGAIAEMIALHYREATNLRGSDEVRGKAVTWLRRAADSARMAAATREAEQHLRAALELAGEGDEAAEMWIQLGGLLRILPGGYEAFRRAHQVAGDPRVRLQALTGMLMAGLRYAVSVTAIDDVDGLVREGEELSRRVADPAMETAFRATLAFIPFRFSRYRDVTAEIDEARRNGQRALDLAGQLGLPELESAALDGLGALAMIAGDWETCRSYARRRQVLEGIPLAELMDADHMVTWACFGLGDPEAALASSESTVKRLRPGQLPEWRLSCMVWRLRSLVVLGRWDEARVAAGDALDYLPVLGPTPWVVQSFPAALAMARGVGDVELAERLAGALRTCLPVAGTSEQRAALAYVDDDLERVQSELTPLAGGEGMPYLADLMACVSDAGAWRPNSWVLHPPRLPSVFMLLQHDRAAGLLEQDPARLERALSVARRCGEVPQVARLAVELGRLKGDPALVTEGRRTLERLGDERQLRRYALSTP